MFGRARVRGVAEVAPPRAGTVRLQWDPDHNPDGSRHDRRKAVQLGLRDVPTFASGEDVLRIDDVTPFVVQQRPLAMADRKADLAHECGDGAPSLRLQIVPSAYTCARISTKSSVG